jgi:hypothetical protein
MPICVASCSKAAMRLAVDGWVENSLSMPVPDSGLMMNRCAVAGFCSAGIFSISCAVRSASVEYVVGATVVLFAGPRLGRLSYTQPQAASAPTGFDLGRGRFYFSAPCGPPPHRP